MLPSLHIHSLQVLSLTFDLPVANTSTATWGIGGRAAGNSRSGSMDGASTLIYSSSRKPLDLAIVLNTRDFGPGVNVDDFYNQVQALVDTTIVQI